MYEYITSTIRVPVRVKSRVYYEYETSAERVMHEYSLKLWYLANLDLDDYRRLWPSLSGVETKKLSYAANAKKMARSESHRAKCFGVSRLW